MKFDLLGVPLTEREVAASTTPTRPALWPHQERAVAHILRARRTWLAFDMATGKSRCILEAMGAILDDPAKHGVAGVGLIGLVACPLAMVTEWRDKHVPLFGDKRIRVLALSEGSGKKKAQLVREAVQAQRAQKSGFLLIVANYQAISYDWIKRGAVMGPLGKALSEARIDFMACDESHMIKSHNSNQSIVCWHLGRSARWRMCLTGTPMPNGPADVFGQVRFLDGSILPTTPRGMPPMWTHFAKRYLVERTTNDGTRFFDPSQTSDNIGELWDALTPYVLRAERKDVLTLPPQQFEWVTLDLPSKTRKLYDTLEAELVVYIDHALQEGNPPRVVAANAAVLLLRLQMLAAGATKDDEDRTIPFETPKRDALRDLLAGLPFSEPGVVFGRFQNDCAITRSAATELGRPLYIIDGKHKQLGEWRTAVEDARANHLPGPIVFVNIQSGGAGIDLSLAWMAVYLTFGFNAGDYEQSLARLHRPGQRQAVVYYHLVCRDTVDEDVRKAVEAKCDFQRQTLARLTAGALGGAKPSGTMQELLGIASMEALDQAFGGDQ